MGNCKSLAAGFGLVVCQPLVEVQWVLGAQGRQRRQWNNLTCPDPVVTQDDVAVQVEAFGDRRPFKADQGREAAWLIIAISGLGHIVPERVVDFRARRVLIEEFHGNLHLREMGDQIKSSLAGSLAALLKTFSPFLALGHRHYVRCTTLDVKRDPHHVGMVRYHQPV